MNAYAKQASNYLAQRIMAASPEQQAALIMEAGQLHLGKAIQAIDRNDQAAATSSFLRVSEVIQEASIRLNTEDGGELVGNLGKLYGWWMQEIMQASRTSDTARLAAVAQGMGEIRQGWEQLHSKKVGVGAASAGTFSELVG